MQSKCTAVKSECIVTKSNLIENDVTDNFSVTTSNDDTQVLIYEIRTLTIIYRMRLVRKIDGGVGHENDEDTIHVIR